MKDSPVSHSVTSLAAIPDGNTSVHTTRSLFIKCSFMVFIISINYSGRGARTQTTTPKVLTLDSRDCPAFGSSSLTLTCVTVSFFCPVNDKLGFKPCLPDVIFGRIPKALPIFAPLSQGWLIWRCHTKGSDHPPQ